MARIALDAMGGDFAPDATIGGALLALQELDESHSIQLIGPVDVVEPRLNALLAGTYAAAEGQRHRISLVHAAEVIDMSEKPSAALRGKPQSSMHIGLRMQAEGTSDAFVSAGNTGAQMAISTFILRLHEGLSRPAISTVFPTARQPIVVLDSGANVDCSAQELLQFARLGAVYAEDILGRTNPSVGLLSIGEEAEKGNAVTKEANALLATSGLNFQGNVEGRDLPLGASDRGPIDVVVCDGFVGNVLLKFYEGVAPMIVNLVLDRLGISKEKVGASMRHLDYSEVGGAPLLGVRGVSIIAHGKSSARALKNALKIAALAVHSRMNDHIGRRLAERPGAVA